MHRSLCSGNLVGGWRCGLLRLRGGIFWNYDWRNGLYLFGRLSSRAIRCHNWTHHLFLYSSMSSRYLRRDGGAICLYELRSGAIRWHYRNDGIRMYGSLCSGHLVGSGSVGL